MINQTKEIPFKKKVANDFKVHD